VRFSLAGAGAIGTKHLDAITRIDDVEAAILCTPTQLRVDNAVATMRAGSKTELIHRNGTWRNVEHVEWATLNHLDWFNNRRIYESLDYVSRVEFEKSYYDSSESESLPVLEVI
jgi:transposase InsO family protein